MAAVAFLRTELYGEVAVQFLMAKSRLCPTAKLTIPRSELVSSVMAVRIATTISEVGNEDISKFTLWSDSTTVLAWIRKNGIWGIFVKNRVTEILKNTSFEQWRHVPASVNPADLPSRGCCPQSLFSSTWWKGPEWLSGDKKDWPGYEPDVNEEEVMVEVKATASLWTATTPVTPRFSSYRANVAVYGWVLRILNLVIYKKKIPKSRFLTILELEEAEKIIIRKIQGESFPPDCVDVGGIQVMRDKFNILRVKTRLTYRNDTEDFKYPVVLPKHHPMVDLLIQDVHLFHTHGGVKFLLSKIREEYWIIQSKRVIRRVIRGCTKCQRYKAKHMEVETSSLPPSRVQDGECFATTGVDLAGPLFFKSGKKAWIVLYTCAVYRAVELDFVSSLSTEAFLQSLERFISTHGRPNTLYTDNGTNFVGAANLFKTLDWKEVEKSSSAKQIRWIFNCPTASWWGGFFERMVRSVKELLRRTLGRSKLDYDKLRTCLAGVTATINDRPLTTVSEDSGDLIALTPAMFMRPKGISHFPELESLSQMSDGYRKMKEHQRRLQARCRKEYLSLLVSRTEKKRQDEINVGDIVLVGADNRKRFEWPMGVVVSFLPSKDGKKRVAKVKTAGGVIERPVQRLYQMKVTRRDESFKRKTSNSPVKSQHITPEMPVFTKSGRKIKQPVRYGMWNYLKEAWN